MTRTTLSYVAVLCALAVLAVARLSMPEGPAPIAFKLPALVPDEVDKIVLTRADQSVTLERTGPDKSWQVTAPFKYEADSSAVEGLLKTFEKEIPMDLTVTDKAEDHETYEVTPEKAVKVELYKGGNLETAFLMGKNASGGSSYIRPVNSQEVFRAKVGSKARFDKKPADWREKRIFNFKKEDVTRLEVQDGEQHLVFTQVGGKWAAEQPAGFQIDQLSVDSMARSLSSFRAADILEKAEGETGMDKPTLKLVATLPSGTKTLLVGREKGTGEYYAQREGDPQLFTVREGPLKAFRKTPEELRDKSVFHFDPEEVNDVLVARGAKKVHLKLEGDSWKVAEPEGMAVDSKAVQQLMAGITTMRIANFAPGTSAKAAGFDKDPLEVTLGMKSGGTAGLKIGGEKDKGELYAVRSDNPEVFTLREFSVNSFKRILGEPVPQAAQAGGMMAGARGLPPGMKLPPGLQLPQQ